MANPQDNDNVVDNGIADIGDLRRKLQALTAQLIDVTKRAKSVAEDYSEQKKDLNEEIKLIVAQLENLDKSV